MHGPMNVKTVVFLFLINSQLKTNAQNGLHLDQPTRGHV